MSQEIKDHISNKINSLKTGDEYNILLANEMEMNSQNIQCFYCLDTKQIWGYRSDFHVFWSRFANNHHTFWVGHCNKCGENKFLYDTNTNEIIIDNCYKLFNIDDLTSSSRINELMRISKKKVDEIYNNQKIIKNMVNDFLKNESIPPNESISSDEKNEIVYEEPDYEVEANFFTQNISKNTFSADIKKISQILGAALQAQIGIPNIDLLNKIELSISFESIHKRKEQVFYKSSDNNEFFIFIIMKHVVKDKNGNMLSILNGEKYNSSIDCYYWIYKTKNQSAIDVCKKKIKEAVDNEINFMSHILKLHYETKDA